MKTDSDSPVSALGGEFQFPGSPLKVKRMGYGAMQLAGPGVFGPPKDTEAAVAVLREAIASGVNHIDTSDFYGPYVTNEIIHKALHPYPENLVIVTKVGATRGADASWIMSRSPESLKSQVHDNLKRLQLEAMDIVNLRVGAVSAPDDESIAEPLSALVELQKEGLIRHIGLSNVSQKQFDEGSAIADIVCIQNYYNVAYRTDDAFIDYLAEKGVAYVPFFPLGGFSPLQSSTLDQAAESMGATSRQLALAWLLQRSPNILLIPGTSSVKHLHENLGAADIEIPAEILEQLNGLAAAEPHQLGMPH